MPVYLDHILYPTLREEDYLTEVHHINGEGQDTGVVYSEMQVCAKIMLMVCVPYLYWPAHTRPANLHKANQ